MRHIILGLAILLASPATAQSAGTPATASAVLQASTLKNGQTVYSSDGKRIGTLNRIDSGAAGEVVVIKVIAGDHMVTLAGSTLSLNDAKLVTSLTKADVNKLH